MRMRPENALRMLLCAAFLVLQSSLFISCSESDDEEADDFANWQVRNEAFFASLEDSLSRDAATWMKIKSFTKDAGVAGSNTDYIYVKVLESGDGNELPLYNDTARISYLGRLIPTAKYPEGMVFDRTYFGSYSVETTTTSTLPIAGYIIGFATALLHMHRGDRWRIFIPRQLGYDETPQTSIPAYSTLIFDVAMIDFWHPGEQRPSWKARQTYLR